VNIHAQGGHLLCHDDVIGDRAVSFIIYLVDPDVAWTAQDGGCLELYPLQQEVAAAAGAPPSTELHTRAPPVRARSAPRRTLPSPPPWLWRRHAPSGNPDEARRTAGAGDAMCSGSLMHQHLKRPQHNVCDGSAHGTGGGVRSARRGRRACPRRGRAKRSCRSSTRWRSSTCCRVVRTMLFRYVHTLHRERERQRKRETDRDRDRESERERESSRLPRLPPSTSATSQPHVLA
jgi:hypothetical protein